MEIEAGAKRRLADEYDAAQDRGEARTRGGDRSSKLSDEKFGPSDSGLTDGQLNEARKLRDVEVREPAELAGDIENPAHEALRKMVLGPESLDATIVQFDPGFRQCLSLNF